MPSHIFTRVGALAGIDRVQPRFGPGRHRQDVRQVHAYDYMVYAHLQLGQDAAAREVVADARKIRRASTISARLCHCGDAGAPGDRARRLEGRPRTSRSLRQRTVIPGRSIRKPSDQRVCARPGRSDERRSRGCAGRGHAAGEAARCGGSRKIGYWAEESDIQADVVRWLALCAEGKRAEASRSCASPPSARTRARSTSSRRDAGAGARGAGQATLDGGDARWHCASSRRCSSAIPTASRLCRCGQAAERSGDAKKAAFYSARLVEMTKAADSSLPEIAQAKRLLGMRAGMQSQSCSARAARSYHEEPLLWSE